MNRSVIAILASLLLGACATTPHLQSSAAVEVIGAMELPSPTGAVGDTGADIYRIGALDKLIVDVYGFETLNNREFQVDGAGRISVPMAGSVDVGSLTPAEAEALISQRLLAAHVRNPKVSVNLGESLSRFVTVDGEVGKPGNYPVVSKMTLMRAVAAASGAGEFARLDDVVVFRTVNGKRMAGLYNLGAIRRAAYADPRIYPMDIIVVGNSSARRLFRDIVLTAPLLAATIIAIAP